jgi:hypothetical protein
LDFKRHSRRPFGAARRRPASPVRRALEPTTRVSSAPFAAIRRVGASRRVVVCRIVASARTPALR